VRPATFPACSVALSRQPQTLTIDHHRVTQEFDQRQWKMAPSSSPSSSQQSSLYQYYPPIASNDSSSQSTSRVLQPSTHQNIAARRSRIAVKRPLHPSTSISPPPKKPKSDTIQQRVSSVPQNISRRRHERETLPRSLITRGLQGQRGRLAQRILPKQHGC
jgi:hypothetical protein